MPVFDNDRCRELVKVGAGLCLIGLALNFLFLRVSAATRGWWVSEQRGLSIAEREMNYRRAGGIAKELESETDSRLLVYFGMSTANDGIDPSRLKSLSGHQGQVLGIVGNGGAMEGLRQLVRPYSIKGIKLPMVLLCVHPAWLVGHPLNRSSVEWNWAREFGPFLRDKVYFSLFDARYRFGLIGPALHPFSPLEWRPPPAKASPTFLVSQLIQFTQYGWFDPKAYDRLRESQMGTLLVVLADLERLAERVTVILMPEMRRMRELVPPEAESFLTTRLSQQAGKKTRILNLRDGIGDTDFSDYYHLNSNGRRRFTEILADTLDWITTDQLASARTRRE